MDAEVRSRLESIEKAVEVAHDDLVRVPTAVDKAVQQVREILFERISRVEEHFEIHLEMFRSVQNQFSERDVRTEQTSRDSKVAVDAALQAAKEAVGKQQDASDRAIAKQEAATAKLLESISQLIATNTKASDDKSDDLKQRIVAMEARDVGMKGAVSAQQQVDTRSLGIIGMVLGTLVGIGGIVVAIFSEG